MPCSHLATARRACQSPKALDPDIRIVSGGPAGEVAGLLFARAGLPTLVQEKHGDFLRDFRGDTLYLSTLWIFDEFDLLDELLECEHNQLLEISAGIAGRR